MGDRPRNTPKRQCKAKSKRTGKRCGNAAMHGAMVCAMHGGKAPQVQAKAEQRVAEDRARAEASRAIDRLGLHDVDPDGYESPIDALLSELTRSGLAVEYYAARVAELDAVDLTEDTIAGPQPNVWVRLWTMERAQHATIARHAVRAGLDERRVRIAEVQATIIVAAFDRLLGNPEVGLSAEQRKTMRRLLGTELRALATPTDTEAV